MSYNICIRCGSSDNDGSELCHACRNGDMTTEAKRLSTERIEEIRNGQKGRRFSTIVLCFIVDQLLGHVEALDEQIDRQGKGIMDAAHRLQVATDRIRELEEDKARVEWLEKNHVQFAEELQRLGWVARNDAQWEKLKLFLRRLRCAIDAARKEK